ncbi:unnamed protein product [Oikopleura dioica]|uniref:Golgi SNAP receptor complex member 1 n=1 Tax=Oikopleura dioica TaxID=34765 RepID=E4Z1F4_OIKDI|nr:unnamed protein product [Oikopleura dioica]
MSWEIQFRKTEAQLDIKLASFLNPQSFANVDHIENDINLLLDELTVIIDGAEQTISSSPSFALQHKVARHRDVLSDYYSQFKRAKEKTRATKNRVDLLGSVRNDIEAYRNKSYSNEQTLNKENDKLKSSHNLADQAIKIAMDTQESLRFQRSLYKGINKRFLELGQKFPMLNSLIGRIKNRKKRDSLIMGTVVGFCIILILYYSGWI